MPSWTTALRKFSFVSTLPILATGVVLSVDVWVCVYIYVRVCGVDTTGWSGSGSGFQRMRVLLRWIGRQSSDIWGFLRVPMRN